MRVMVLVKADKASEAGVLPDEKIRRYFELGCEVRCLGRGHVQRIKEAVQAQRTTGPGE